MRRSLLPLSFGLAGLALLVSGSAVLGQPATAPRETPAVVVVRVPADAQVQVEGVATQSRGEVRRFQSPPLAPGKQYKYSIKVSWKDNGKDMTREQEVVVRAGQTSEVDLRAKAATAPAAGAAPKPDAKPATPAATAPERKPEPKSESRPATNPAPKPEPKAETKPDAKPEAKPDAKPEKKDDAKAESKPPAKANDKSKSDQKSDDKKDQKPEEKKNEPPPAR